ncbi:major facilitator superfamily domain-containing protein [Pilobolus umbonatus]|nr:major facilitator superfamily domain-containing protein [Pilobolus umbonatus]
MRTYSSYAQSLPSVQETDRYSRRLSRNSLAGGSEGDLRSENILQKPEMSQFSYKAEKRHSVKSSTSDKQSMSHIVYNPTTPYSTNHLNHSITQSRRIDHYVEPKTYPIAWFYLFCFVVLRAAVAMFANTFNPIPSVTAEFLSISLTEINWIYNIMAIGYIIVSCFTSWIYKVLGVKWSLVFSGVILSLGCWIRWVAVKLINPSFGLMILGQTVASCSSPISLNLTTTFASLWFAENRRATAGMFIVSNYGAIIALFLIPVIATGKDKIELTVTMVAGIATAATIPLLFFPSKPPTPASTLKRKESDDNMISLIEETKQLFQNPQFMIICLVHSLSIALCIEWNGLMNQAITPYGYTNSQVGNITAMGVLADRTKQHKILLKIMTPLMFSTYVAYVFIVKSDSFAAILYVNGMSQFFLCFLIPVCIELAVEVSYPVTESLSNSILWQLSQLLGFIFVIIMDLFRDTHGVPKNNMHNGLVFQAIVAGLCCVISFTFNGDMKRTHALDENRQFYEENYRCD